MAHTTRTKPARPVAAATLTVSSFDRLRDRRRPVPAAQAPRLRGSARAFDPRRDLQMFDPWPRPVLAASVEELAPLLPPVISEPPRARVLALPVSPYEAAPAPRQARPLVSRAPRRARLRLTLRGYGVLLGLAVAAVAGTSAVTVAQSPAVAAVPAVEVVVLPGESVEQLAARAADGRSVEEVAAAIRAANGLGGSEVPAAGEVLVVPGG